MPQGSKASYTGKQKRKARHIEKGYEKRGVPEGEAERRAWATVNKESGGGKKSGTGRGHSESHAASSKGGRLGGGALAVGQEGGAHPQGARALDRRQRRPADAVGKKKFGAPRQSCCAPKVCGAVC
jgi:plasmid stabilization system protein ParE